MTNPTPSAADRIKIVNALMSEFGIKQDYLVRNTGYSPTHVSQVLLGKRAASGIFLADIERLLAPFAMQSSAGSFVAISPAVAPSNGIKRRGFASLSVERRREIAQLGGRRAHELGTAHEWDHNSASAAGKIGGRSKSKGNGRHPRA